jgi:thioredoxin-like negative regulator of GroEL
LTANRPVLTLYSRKNCHLCDVMAAELQPILDRFSARVQVLDVDADPSISARFGTQVPVLLLDGKILSRFHLDAAAVEDALASVAT